MRKGVRCWDCLSLGRICSARIRASSVRLNHRMDAVLKGHPICEERRGHCVLGYPQASSYGMPDVRSCSSGRLPEKVRLYRAYLAESPEEMAAKVAGYRAEGYTRFQLKVGGDPDTIIALSLTDLRARRDKPDQLGIDKLRDVRPEQRRNRNASDSDTCHGRENNANQQPGAQNFRPSVRT